jgi:hypothetical protein
MRNRSRIVSLFALAALGLMLGPSGLIASPAAPHSSASETVQPGQVTLTSDLVGKLLKAEQGIVSTAPRDVNLEMSLAMNGSPDAWHGWLTRIKSNPKTVEVIQAAGLTPEEYLSGYIAVIQASAVAGAAKQGQKIPDALKAQVPAANVSYVDSHSGEIGQIAKPGSPVKPNTMEDIYASSDAPKDDAKAPPPPAKAKKQ